MSQDVLHGRRALFQFRPDPGYLIDSVSGCGGSLIGEFYTTEWITAECAISVSFTRNPAVIHHYPLNNSLDDVVNGVALTSHGNGVLEAEGYRVNGEADSGLTLVSDLMSRKEYAISMILELQGLPEYSRLIDFKERG